MNKVGYYIIPAAIFLIVLSGILGKVKIFDEFLDGAKEGLKASLNILPALIGLITAVSMLEASGAIDIFANFISPVTSFIGIPADVIPLALLRPFSGSGSIALLDNIFRNNSPDSFTGRLASVMMGSSETTFYAISVYYGAVNIKHTRHTVICAIFGDLCTFILAFIFVKLLFT